MRKSTTLLFYTFLVFLLPLCIIGSVQSLASFIEPIAKINRSETIVYSRGEENLTETPAYLLQLFSDKALYDKGDKVLISVYITGAGGINESAILGHVPQNIMSGNTNIVLFKFAKSSEWEGWKPVFPQEEFKMENRFVGILSPGYFSINPAVRPMLWSENVS